MRICYFAVYLLGFSPVVSEASVFPWMNFLWEEVKKDNVTVASQLMSLEKQAELRSIEESGKGRIFLQSSIGGDYQSRTANTLQRDGFNQRASASVNYQIPIIDPFKSPKLALAQLEIERTSIESEFDQITVLGNFAKSWVEYSFLRNKIEFLDSLSLALRERLLEMEEAIRIGQSGSSELIEATLKLARIDVELSLSRERLNYLKSLKVVRDVAYNYPHANLKDGIIGGSYKSVTEAGTLTSEQFENRLSLLRVERRIKEQRLLQIKAADLSLVDLNLSFGVEQEEDVFSGLDRELRGIAQLSMRIPIKTYGNSDRLDSARAGIKRADIAIQRGAERLERDIDELNTFLNEQYISVQGKIAEMRSVDTEINTAKVGFRKGIVAQSVVNSLEIRKTRINIQILEEKYRTIVRVIDFCLDTKSLTFLLGR